MVNPTTVNVGIIVPLTGADVDTWGQDDVNPNMVAIDGMLAGVQTITLSASNVILTKPSGFTPTPGGGPTQSQNRVLVLTGTLLAQLFITLPLPGAYIVDNQSNGNFNVFIVGGTATEYIAIPQGAIFEVYNDGTRVKFIGLGKPGDLEFFAGVTQLPGWIPVCTVPPYLLCDGSVYNFSQFPHLGRRLGSSFGGNGITTFGVPDLRGRVPLAYDGTGVRITLAGSGLNGQQLGAALDQQSITLLASQIPAISSINPSVSFAASVTANNWVASNPGDSTTTSANADGGNLAGVVAVGSTVTKIVSNGTASGSVAVASNNTSGLPHPNVQPSLVAGIWAIKT